MLLMLKNSNTGETILEKIETEMQIRFVRNILSKDILAKRILLSLLTIYLLGSKKICRYIFIGKLLDNKIEKRLSEQSKELCSNGF